MPSPRVFKAGPHELAPTEVTCPDPVEDDWVGIVANRNSGSGRGLWLVKRLVRALGRVALCSTVAWTVEERVALVSESARDASCRCLVAVGGDGTVSALVNERPGVPVTVLPAGTENLAARHFGLRRDPDALALAIADCRVVRVDLGLAERRRFLLMVGFGFDGDVVTRHHRSRISSSGVATTTSRVAYVEPILRSSLFYRFPRITVQIKDHGAEEVLSGTTVFVFNLPRYALGLPFVPEARENDGWLDLVVFREPGPFQALYYLWKVFRGSHLDEPGVFHRRVRKVVVTSDHAIPVQLDGDPGGYVLPPEVAPYDQELGGQSAASWTIEVLPAALDVIAAADRPPRPVRLPLAGDGVGR